MLCLKVVYNAINNYQSCQSLYDFVQLSLISTIKEPKRSLSNKCDLTNNFIHVKKKRIYLDCKRFVNLELSGHRASSKKYPLLSKNWRFVTWGL